MNKSEKQTMNPKFLKYWNEAHKSGGIIHSSELNKFAELIVEKFDIILALEYLDCVGNNNKTGANRVQLLRERVKEYFGMHLPM